MTNSSSNAAASKDESAGTGGAEVQSVHRAVALISGGLDSLLAARLMLDQGIHVEGLNFYTGFCVEGHTHSIRKKDVKRPRRNNALWVAEQLGIKLHIIDVVEEYKDIVLNPKHGYGANLNPCLDCKGFMVGKANKWMLSHGFDFIVTGEVMGQRPMSQRKQLMPIVAAESGANDRLFRPLSANLLPPTLPEQEKWVDMSKLPALSGRSRKPQIAMAHSLGFDDYAQPAGGCCFLTDKNYARKLQDLWQGRGERDYEMDDIMLLKVGRHLRPRPHFKLIIAREEGENRFLEGYRKQFVHLKILSHRGPLCLLDGTVDADDLHLAARIVCRYSQGRDAAAVQVEINEPGLPPRIQWVKPMPSDEIPQTWHV